MKTEANKTISGFSKLSKRKKIKWIVENFFRDPEKVMRELISYWHRDEKEQKVLDEISENTISNYPLPYGVAPNFVIDGKPYVVPMVTEESSVVAAAGSAAKYWMSRGGFKTEILGTSKLGHIHFLWEGDFSQLLELQPELEAYLQSSAEDLTSNMCKRGGGILSMELKDYSTEMEDYFQLLVAFETCDSMGANFINSILERFAKAMETFFHDRKELREELREIDVIMSILSNHTPECVVRAEVCCRVEDLMDKKIKEPDVFADRFKKAIDIAQIDSYRAATHNKGIFNGVDAVLIATANDFRAVEAAGHCYAVKDGVYRGLSHCRVEDGLFRFWVELPVAVGTVGGLTAIHPMARNSFELLGSPDAQQLMSIIASVGLAQNFSAIRSLVTTGIQKGHMRMHLGNMLNSLGANEEEKEAAISHFAGKTVNFNLVERYMQELRG